MSGPPRLVVLVRDAAPTRVVGKPDRRCGRTRIGDALQTVHGVIGKRGWLGAAIHRVDNAGAVPTRVIVGEMH
jgi:hypothetical protein